jgi:hypothetical protein
MAGSLQPCPSQNIRSFVEAPAAETGAFASVVAVLALTALVASAGPVRRAAGVDPTRVLRAE